MQAEQRLPLADEHLCYCGKQPLDPDNATYVLRGVAICNHRCFKKAEEEQLKRIARAAGTVSSP